MNTFAFWTSEPQRGSRKWIDCVHHRLTMGAVQPELSRDMTIELAPNGLPESSQWLFPEYDFGQMKPNEYAGVIIERILDRGSWAEVNWLFEQYGEQRIALWVQQHGFRLLSPRSFALWRLNLNIADFVAPDWAREAKAMTW